MRIMFFEPEQELEFLPDETCAECGEVVYGGQMPRHFAKDHARCDEIELTADELEGSLYYQPPVSAFVLEARTHPHIPSLVAVHAWAAEMLQEAY